MQRLLTVLLVSLALTGCQSRPTPTDRQQATIDFIQRDPRVVYERLLSHGDGLELWTQQGGVRVVYLIHPELRPDGLHRIEVVERDIPSLPIDPNGPASHDHR